MPSSCLCEHIICFDWYDGPVKAIASHSGRAIRLSMIDADATFEKRAFLVRSIDAHWYSTLLETIRETEPPKYPIWVPSASPELDEFPDPAPLNETQEELWITDRYLSVSYLRSLAPDETPPEWSWEDDADHGLFIKRHFPTAS